MNESQLAVRRHVQVAYVVNDGASIYGEDFLPSPTFIIGPTPNGNFIIARPPFSFRFHILLLLSEVGPDFSHPQPGPVVFNSPSQPRRSEV